jgi:hypothetical protein
MTTATPEQLRMRLRRREGDPMGGKQWKDDIEFQRLLVWTINQKQKLIDSMKKRLPFGMITVIDYNGVTYIIDGKQRTTTIVSFMCNEFPDTEGKTWEEWSAEERGLAGRTPIAVQEVELEEGEGMADIVELFRRINTQSKQLTTGQLLASCMTTDTMVFMDKVFKKPIVEGEQWSAEITAFRERWSGCFCKGTYGIKGGGKSRGDITFLAGLVIPLLTGNSAAITTSFPIMYENGLTEAVNDEMRRKFFAKMNTLLSICEEGYALGYFKKSPKGFPTYGEISAFIHLVNVSDGLVVIPPKHYEPALQEECREFIEESNNAQTFFKRLHDDDGLASTWKLRQRKNRNIDNLNKDIKFMQGKCDCQLEWDDEMESSDNESPL